MGGEKKGMKALEVWSRQVTDGYKDVCIVNMTTSWKDGLAFCALIHHFRSDLIDFDSLSKENVFYNNDLAFTIAEQKLGIPALLDAEDMVQCKIPDKLSIMTYVSQYYNYFEGSPAKSPIKRPALVDCPGDHILDQPSNKIFGGSKYVSSTIDIGKRQESCEKCKNRVYILERLIIDNKLFHRTCFRCFKCNSLLKPGSYVDGDQDNTYECLMCPDEEKAGFDFSIIPSTADIKRNFAAEIKEVRPKETPKTDHLKVRLNASKAMNRFLSQSQETDSEKQEPLSPREPSGPVGDDAPSDNYEADVSSYEVEAEEILERLSGDENGDSATSSSDDENDTDGSRPTSSCDVSKDGSNVDVDIIGKNNSDVSKLESVKRSELLKMPVISNSLTRLSTSVIHGDGSVEGLHSETKRSVAEMKSLRRKSPEPDRDSDAKSCEHVGDNDPEDDTLERHSTSARYTSIFDARLKSAFSTSEERSGTNDGAPSSDDADVLSASIECEENFQKADVSMAANKMDEFETENSKFSESVPLDTKSEVSGDASDGICEIPGVLNSQIYLVDSITIVESLVDGDDGVEVEKSVGEDTMESDSLKPTPETTRKRNSLNPFDSDDDEDSTGADEDVYPDGKNPFGDSGDDENPGEIKDAPSVSLETTNPFSDSEDDDTNPFADEAPNTCGDDWIQSVFGSKTLQVPGHTPEEKPVPKPRKVNLDTSRSSSLGRTSGRMKKRAPLPPANHDLTPKTSKTLSHDVKSKPPPPPPRTYRAATLKATQRSLPKEITASSDGRIDEDKKENETASSGTSVVVKSTAEDTHSVPPPKLTFGYWKKKKKAPPIPVPPKRQISKIPLKTIQLELGKIEEQQLSLECEGVDIEKRIRDMQEDEATAKEEELVMELFELVHRKNELFRRQAELIHMKRQNRLEEEHCELEFQIRILMQRPANVKTDSDKEKEEELLSRLMEIVQQRNDIIESQERDRLRIRAEEKGIREELAAKETATADVLPCDSKGKSKKEKKKKKKKLKKADKPKKDKDVKNSNRRENNNDKKTSEEKNSETDDKKAKKSKSKLHFKLT